MTTADAIIRHREPNELSRLDRPTGAALRRHERAIPDALVDTNVKQSGESQGVVHGGCYGIRSARHNGRPIGPQAASTWSNSLPTSPHGSVDQGPPDET